MRRPPGVLGRLFGVERIPIVRESDLHHDTLAPSPYVQCPTRQASRARYSEHDEYVSAASVRLVAIFLKAAIASFPRGKCNGGVEAGFASVYETSIPFLGSPSDTNSSQTARRPTLGRVGLLYADGAGTQFVFDMPGVAKPPGARMVTCRVPR